MEALEQFDQDWLLVSAVRQAFGIAIRGAITYEQAVSLTRTLAPQLLRETSPLVEAFESEIVKLYRERAEARSAIEDRSVTPLEMLDLEIGALEEELEQSDFEQGKAIRTQLWRLQRARSRLDTTEWTESQAIRRDENAPATDLPISDRGQTYTQFQLEDNRWLRVRVLHPDPPEAVSGVDLVYETYWEKQADNCSPVRLVRIAALQYKMWDGKALYTSQSANLRAQMERMRRVFCETGFCEHPSTPGGDERYRLPHCCAFLRPTDRRQTRDAWRVTRAWHIPICVALEDMEPTDQGHEVLRSKQVSCKATTQGTFEELYNRGMLGSRWISAAKLRELYAQIGIFDDPCRAIVHSQEYSQRKGRHPDASAA